MSEIIEYIAVGLLVLGVALALVITTIHPPMPIDPRQCRTSRRTRLSEHRRHPDIRPFTATDCGQRPDHGCAGAASVMAVPVVVAVLLRSAWSGSAWP